MNIMNAPLISGRALAIHIGVDPKTLATAAQRAGIAPMRTYSGRMRFSPAQAEQVVAQLERELMRRSSRPKT
jgi:hypothetical protein